MTNAIILHGMPGEAEYYDHSLPSESNAHWLPWLQKELLITGIKADTPEVPLSFKPDWEAWCREVERFDIGPETILIGHSCGGGFWLRYLSERPDLHVGKVVLVAPWLDPAGDETAGFFNFKIDSQLAARTDGLTVFYSDNDMGNVHKSVAMVRESLPDADYREFQSFGHFTYGDMGTTEFPELLKLLHTRE